jgi:hypothetical protein
MVHIIQCNEVIMDKYCIIHHTVLRRQCTRRRNFTCTRRTKTVLWRRQCTRRRNYKPPDENGTYCGEIAWKGNCRSNLDSDQLHPFSHNLFSTLEDGNKLDTLSFKMMTITENNKNGMDKEVVFDADITLGMDKEVVIDADITIEDGIRKRGGKNSLAAQAKALSSTSKLWDIDGDGVLDEAEKSLRDMDTDNRGYLTNDKVYLVMLEQMKLQQEVFGLKRMSMVFVAIVFILSLATLGTSFAAATLAKDTNVENGNLMAKDGSGVVGTSNVAANFIVTEAAPTGEDGRGRGLSHGSVEYQLTPKSADEVWKRCKSGQSVLFQRSCDGGATVLDVPICSSSTSALKAEPTGSTGPTYKYPLTSNSETTITCPDSSLESTSPCKVEFANGTPACPTNSVAATHPDDLDAVPVYDIQDMDLNGKVLLPGIYNSASAIVLSGVLTLDPAGDDNAAWTFNIRGTLNTAANSQMIMRDSEGRPANVHWNVDGAITLAADSVAIGDMTCSGAFNIGAGAIFKFDGGYWNFKIGGALTTDAGSEMELTNSAIVIWDVAGAITLGADSIAKGDMNSAQGAITLGARAKSDNLNAFGAITLGALSRSGSVTAIGPITFGAGAFSCGAVNAGAACTGCLGAASLAEAACPSGSI